MNQQKAKERLLFSGPMFIGLGIGFIFNQVAAGVLIGIGIGFVLQFLYLRKNK